MGPAHSSDEGGPGEGNSGAETEGFPFAHAAASRAGYQLDKVSPVGSLRSTLRLSITHKVAVRISSLEARKRPLQPAEAFLPELTPTLCRAEKHWPSRSQHRSSRSYHLARQ